MNVLIDGKPVRLDAKDLIGSGGEGQVFRWDRWAVKIYHQPTPQRAQKLAHMIALADGLPAQRIMYPTRLIQDTHGQTVGLVMPLIGPGFEDLAVLPTRKFRNQFRITTRAVAQLFLDCGATVQAIHARHFCIGDFNDLNQKFQGSTMLFMDVDTWQFGNYPCPVGTEQYLAPELYGIDLGQRPAFQPVHDWYSFAVLLFKSLLGAHPYGGTHRIYKQLTDQARHRITVLDTDVIYPKVAQPCEVLSNDLLSLFMDIFKDGQRSPFPLERLEAYRDNLVDCPNCGATFPAERSACPICSAAHQIVVRHQAGVRVETLFETAGPILFSKVIGSTVYAIADVKGKAVLYNSTGLTAANLTLGPCDPGTRFELTEDGVAYNEARSNVLALLDPDSKTEHARETTTFFSTGRAVFRASQRFLFRIVSGTLMAGQVRFGQYVEQAIRPVMAEHTWFAVRQDVNDRVTLCGYFQVFREQKWWLCWEGRVYDDLPLAELGRTETLVDVLVRFDKESCLVLRQTQEVGLDYLRIASITANGLVAHRPRERLNQALPHGAVYAHGFLLKATDDGLVQENMTTGTVKTFEGTQGLVEEGDTLHRLGNKIVVVKQNRVTLISLS